MKQFLKTWREHPMNVYYPAQRAATDFLMVSVLIPVLAVSIYYIDAVFSDAHATPLTMALLGLCILPWMSMLIATGVIWFDGMVNLFDFIFS